MRQRLYGSEGHIGSTDGGLRATRILDNIVGPDVIAVLGAQPDARSFRKPSRGYFDSTVAPQSAIL
jgi:hypothetical protein